jgi:Ni/Co efflux regulator RcnB
MAYFCEFADVPIRGVFTMRSLAIPAVALVAMAFATPALAQRDSDIGAPPVTVTTGMPDMSGQRMTTRPLVTRPGMPPMSRGRAAAMAAQYREPSYGYQLPREWMEPSNFLADYRAYGLGRPAAGFGWSRYFDVAVLTDQFGRVYDWRNVDWNGGGGRGFDEGGYRDGRSNDGLAGAAVGGIVGSIAGNVIAGRGNRLAGSLAGGGAGALAGMAIDKASRRRHGLFGRRHHDDRRYNDGLDNERDYYRDNDYQRGPHWGGGSYGGGSYGSYDTGGTTVTTVVVHAAAAAPVMQTRTITSYEYVSVPVKRRHVVRHYRPRPKPSCACGS